MIITELGDGLGNEMFVYAAAKNLADYHNTELKLDLSYFDSWPKKKDGGHWDFELGKFNISAKIANKKEVKKFLYKTRSRHLNYLFRKFRILEKKVYDTLAKGYPEEMSDLPDNIYLRGYFGEEKFFKRIKKQIQKEFTLKDEYKENIKYFLKKISEENSVSIHVRRGDLIRLEAFVLPVNYYKHAIKIINKNVKNPKFYVFSDDIKWCKENFKEMGAKLNFMENIKGGYYVLESMKNCKHNILANSALSWWTGYLNSNPKKIVIAPKYFSHFKSEKPESENLPKEWMKI